MKTFTISVHRDSTPREARNLFPAWLRMQAVEMTKFNCLWEPEILTKDSETLERSILSVYKKAVLVPLRVVLDRDSFILQTTLYSDTPEVFLIIDIDKYKALSLTKILTPAKREYLMTFAREVLKKYNTLLMGEVQRVTIKTKNGTLSVGNLFTVKETSDIIEKLTKEACNGRI